MVRTAIVTVSVDVHRDDEACDASNCPLVTQCTFCTLDVSRSADIYFFQMLSACVCQGGRREAHCGEMHADQIHPERKAEAFGNSRVLGPPDAAAWTLLLYGLEW